METGDVNGCLTQYAYELKQAWIAKYGKWDYPDYMTTPMYNTLVDAMQKADSIDVDAVNRMSLGTTAYEWHRGSGWHVCDMIDSSGYEPGRQIC